MSDPNLDQLEDEWQALLASATVDKDPEWTFGMIGIWQEEDGWHYRPGRRPEVRMPAESPSLEMLRESIRASPRAGEHEVERAIFLAVSQARLGTEIAGWHEARQIIEERLSWGVAALALGGVRSSESDAKGAATPLGLGGHAVAGHLDPSIDQAAADLARRHGLPGFRFSGDSWWTEDYLGAKEDPLVGQEHLDQIAEAESWPWLSLVVAVPASGAAAEGGAIATGQALLGALTLLDQSPGTGWAEPVPWIAGGHGPAADPRWPGDEGRDWTLPIAPQHVDAATRRLDNAENDIGNAPARVIDLAAHVHGPSGGLLTAVVDSSLRVSETDTTGESLAATCRLAWLAAATETASTRWSLARSAGRMLVPTDDGVLASLAQEGAEWRRHRAPDWPERDGFGPEPDLDAWCAGMPEMVAGLSAGLTTPSWGAEATVQSGHALELVQALLFAHAARAGVG